MTDLVELYCVKEGSKYRVRISSPGFIRTANCKCPRDIRGEGKRFTVPRSEIKLIKRTQKYFYSITKGIKEIVNTEGSEHKDYKNMKMFQDEDEPLCSICMDKEKDIVFDPCLHFYTCSICAAKMKECPMCKTGITARVPKSQFG